VKRTCYEAPHWYKNKQNKHLYFNGYASLGGAHSGRVLIYCNWYEKFRRTPTPYSAECVSGHLSPLWG